MCGTSWLWKTHSVKKATCCIGADVAVFCTLEWEAMQTFCWKTLFVCFNSFRVSSGHIFLFKPYYAVQFPSPRFHSFQKTCFRFLLNNQNTDKPALWGGGN
jgi:hypothetical protein